ncbi:hypothetical protein AXA65_11280 [Chryseobacterium sp. FP211-J200]|nr:hypothetical protein AXA65_11280 [Chryseobacterium sp. FP211-J200]
MNLKINKKIRYKFLTLTINTLNINYKNIYYFVLHNTILFTYLCNVKLKKDVLEVGRLKMEVGRIKILNLEL